MVFGFFKKDSAPKPIIKTKVDPSQWRKPGVNNNTTPNIETSNADYSFNNSRTPTEFQTTQRTRAMAPKTKMLGLILGVMVFGIYTYTVFNLKQDDFADVIVPENIREKGIEATGLLIEDPKKASS